MTRCRDHRGSQAPSVPGQRSGERMAGISCNVDASIPNRMCRDQEGFGEDISNGGGRYILFLWKVGKSVLLGEMECKRGISV